jgi:hypothetical protein
MYQDVQDFEGVSMQPPAELVAFKNSGNGLRSNKRPDSALPHDFILNILSIPGILIKIPRCRDTGGKE